MMEYTYEVVWVAGEGPRAGKEVCRERIVKTARNPHSAFRKVAAAMFQVEVPSHWVVHEVNFVSRV